MESWNERFDYRSYHKEYVTAKQHYPTIIPDKYAGYRMPWERKDTVPDKIRRTFLKSRIPRTMYNTEQGVYGVPGDRGPQVDMGGRAITPLITPIPYTLDNLVSMYLSEEPYPINFDDILRWRNCCRTPKERRQQKRFLAKDYNKGTDFVVKRGGRIGGTYLTIKCFEAYWEELEKTKWIDRETYSLLEEAKKKSESSPKL